MLNIKGNSIGDRGFKALCETLRVNRSLLSLNLEKNMITPLGMSYLSKVISDTGDEFPLRCLILNKNLIGRNGLEQISQDIGFKTQIQILGLSEVGLETTFSIFQSIKQNVYLERLDLSANILTDVSESQIQSVA